METIKISILILIIISVIFSTLAFILTIFKKNKDADLSIKNSYPYEYYMNMNEKKRTIIYTIICVNMLVSSLASFLALYGLKSAFSLLVAIMFVLAIITFSLGFITPLSKTKTHIILIISSFLLYMSVNIMLAFIKVIEGTIYYGTDFTLTISIILGVCGFISLLSFFNPKLKNWAKLEKSEDNGTTFYIKPKVNYLALYEWIYYILFELSILLISINALINPSII